MIKKRFVGLLLFVSFYAGGQTPKYPVISLPVVRNGITLTNPWTGGFDAPEFSTGDLNNDGVKDLFVFDRSGNKVMVFINGGGPEDTTFHYAPQYEPLFPAMTLWAVLRDYNNDGVPDIFTYQPGGGNEPNGNPIQPGIEVYKGTRPQQGNMQFDVDQYCLYYSAGGFDINLWTNSLGVPAFVDVNHDGALDILDFDVYGSAIGYYENVTASLGLPADSLKFVETSGCWGNIYVSGTTLEVSLDVSCKSNGSGGTPPPAKSGTPAPPYGL